MCLPGGLLSVTSSHEPGAYFPVGETVVQYTAIDAEGNSRTCNLTITVQGTQETHASWLKIYFVKVEWHINIMTSLAFLGTTCEQPYVPVNGEFVCTEEEDGVNCTLHCNVGYSLTQDAVHSYFCAFDGVWKPPNSADRPDCSGKRCLSPFFVSFEMCTVCLGWQINISSTLPSEPCCKQRFQALRDALQSCALRRRWPRQVFRWRAQH